MTRKFIVLDPHTSVDPDNRYGDFSLEFWFMLNGQPYEYHRDLLRSEPVDFLLTIHLWDYEPSLGGCVRDTVFDQYRYQKKVFIDILQNYDDQIKNIVDQVEREEDIVIVNAYDPTVETPPFVIFNDAMFNRTKAYYEAYPFPPNIWRHHWSGSENYKVPESMDPSQKNKIFVCAGTTKPQEAAIIVDKVPHRYYRTRLMEYIKQYKQLGHIGHGDTDAAHVLLTNRQYPDATSVDDLYARKVPLIREFYSPPHSLYYQDSFLSIYGETISHGTTVSPTEKTFDPLIKGHFILPFSCVGFIKYLREFNDVQFPDFIDYSYDSITDNELRFQTYLSEITRLLSLDIDTWRQHWADNLSIIHHNRDIFKKPYHTIDLASLLES